MLNVVIPNKCRLVDFMCENMGRMVRLVAFLCRCALWPLGQREREDNGHGGHDGT